MSGMIINNPTMSTNAVIMSADSRPSAAFFFTAACEPKLAVGSRSRREGWLCAMRWVWRECCRLHECSENHATTGIGTGGRIVGKQHGIRVASHSGGNLACEPSVLGRRAGAVVFVQNVVRSTLLDYLRQKQ